MSETGAEAAAEAQQPMRRTPSTRPTAAEIRAHRVSHLPFRDWCPECVAGRAKDWPHRQQKETEELTIPEINMDYCFIRDEPGDEYSVVLVGKDRSTKLILAHVVPNKGGDVEWVCEQVCRDIKKFGIRGDVVFRSDQEPALVDLLNQICSMRPSSRACTTHSGVGDSKGNGMAERAVQSIEEMVRVHKLAVEARIKERLPCTHPMMAWLVEHAADVLNRYNIGKDGRTPYQRLKGRKFIGNMMEFCSPVMFRVSGKVAGGLMQARWMQGLWVGKKLHSDEHLVMKDDGMVVRSRAVREMDQEISLQDLDKLRSTPHDPLGISRQTTEAPRAAAVPREAVDGEVESKPRRAKITLDVINKYGRTPGCPKCRAIERGDHGGATAAFGHSARCRERIEELMKGDPLYQDRVTRAEERINSNIARYVEHHDPRNKDSEERESKRPRSGAATTGSSQDPSSHAPSNTSSAQQQHQQHHQQQHQQQQQATTRLDDDGDDMGIPQASSSSSAAAAATAHGDGGWPRLADRPKREAPGTDEGPTARRQRLEAIDDEVQYVMAMTEEDDEGAGPFAGLSLPWPLEEQWDELTGKELCKEKVVQGRLKELGKFKERQVYVYHSRDEAMKDEGGKFVKTRWVQTEKGDEVRCRLVAQEFAHGDPRDDLFAGTPPLFAARLLVSRAASRARRDWTLMCLDVSCAFLYAPIKRRVYIELPAEDPLSATGQWVGKLERALYGTRDAPQAWLEELSMTLTAMGFQSSSYFPGVYWNSSLEVMMVTHVDDLLCSGPEGALKQVRNQLQKKYEVKGDLLGSDVTELKFLGRVISHDEWGFYWEEDPKHRRILLEEWGMTECNDMATPVTAIADRDQQLQEPQPMEQQEARRYRRAVARLSYLAQDRPDLGFAANLMARTMANPRQGDEVKVKRALRYLQGHPICRLQYHFQDEPKTLTTMTDSDWAGDVSTRRSTSGVMVVHGSHLVHFSSRLQKTVALSSGEAELNALVTGLSEAIGICNVLREWGGPATIASFCDSSAARGIASRYGVGKIKHLEVRQLWVQEQIARGRVSVQWLSRKANSSDVLTHPCTEDQMQGHLSRVAVCVERINARASIRGGVLESDPAYAFWSTPHPRINWADCFEDCVA